MAEWPKWPNPGWWDDPRWDRQDCRPPSEMDPRLEPQLDRERAEMERLYGPPPRPAS
jgi:hypothetical protein